MPDADVLSHIEEVLEVSVSELLGAEIKQEDSKNKVAEQLAKISEQLAIKIDVVKRFGESSGLYCWQLLF